MKNKILAVLKNDTRLWQDEEFNQTLLIDLVEKYDKEVISILFEDEKLKQQFFVQVNNAWVFKVRDFVFFIEENKVNNSYTDYKNRIGLTDGKHFLKDTQDVVLDFPFKDCILEGGQSNDEGADKFYQFDEKVSAKDEKLGHKPNQYNLKQAKRKEVFFNQVLAKDEIDRLLDPKALTNGKKYTKDGINDEVKFNRDENGLIKDNLIIKGNNLLALHTLKSNFAGKVKLIYIDPPYNTGGASDTFSYNNNFNHSTWLTFMKNRLEVAKELLRDDGFVAITIDHVELFYLGVIADEIFGEENRIGIVTIYINPKGRQHEKFFAASTEHMLVYTKNYRTAKFNKITIDESKKQKFTHTDNKGIYRLDDFARIRTSTLRVAKPNFWYPIYVNKTLDEISLEPHENWHKVYPVSNNKEYTWKIQASSFEERNKNKEYVALKEDNNITICNKYYERQVFKNIWTNKKYFSEFQGTNLLKSIIGSGKFSYPKSLYSVLDTLKIMTSSNDIILDYHAGSGTTAHAVLELNKEDGSNRQFIMVEQMDYIKDVTCERVHKVIQNNKSDSDFIYFELAKWNEQAKDKINACENLEALISLFDDLYDQYFLNYNLKITEFKEKVILEKNFKNLGLDKQKQMFLTMLDLNQMYVNKSEMADSKYQLSKENQNLTKDFYGNK